MPIQGSNKKQYQKEYMQRKRSNSGSNISLGSNKKGLTKQGSNSTGLTDSLDNISSIFKTSEGLDKLRAIIDSFEDSNHPEYMKEVRLGTFGPTLDYIKRLYV